MSNSVVANPQLNYFNQKPGKPGKILLLYQMFGLDLHMYDIEVS